MSARFLSAAGAALFALVLGWATMPAAWGDDGSGAFTSTGASASGGVITVDAGVTTWTPPVGSSWATATKSDPSGGKPNPKQPYGCTYTADPKALQVLGVGGPTPGQWIIPMCAGPGVIDPMPPFWVSGAKPATVTVQVAPIVVAEQAAKTLGLSSPVIEMAPPNGALQLVRVATWLWVNPASWRPVSASATAGAVTATATATATQVVLDMGDGSTVTCVGPGTPYDPSAPDASSSCSYTWMTAGTYTVTATTYWSVTWSAAGAAGGGTLGVQTGPPAQVKVHVVQSQAINTPSSVGG
jgi:hypothetical protein